MSQCEKTCEFYEACHQSMQRQGETDWQDTTEGTRARQLARVAKYKAEHPESEKKDPMSNDHEECPDCAADLAASQERQRLGMLSGTRIRCVLHSQLRAEGGAVNPFEVEPCLSCTNEACSLDRGSGVAFDVDPEELESEIERILAEEVCSLCNKLDCAQRPAHAVEVARCRLCFRVRERYHHGLLRARQLARVAKYKAEHPDSKETLLQAAGEMLALCAQWAKETRAERARFSSLRLSLCEVLSADEAEKIRAEERVAGLRGDRLEEACALVETMLRAAGLSEEEIVNGLEKDR